MNKEYMHLNAGDKFKKTISPDGQVLPFKKKQKISAATLNMINALFDENKELMEKLKDK
ncbi:hypothetical protein [Lactobacillus sp. PV034]|uniref:hypothetical protein n=1 Tax=Lactobacillus sp. PV034 TaxID=2594495 RepID=UPI00223F9D5B|nr:hypothetical protein [Lactobacillus sp. PV034]